MGAQSSFDDALFRHVENIILTYITNNHYTTRSSGLGSEGFGSGLVLGGLDATHANKLIAHFALLLLISTVKSVLRWSAFLEG